MEPELESINAYVEFRACLEKRRVYEACKVLRKHPSLVGLIGLKEIGETYVEIRKKAPEHADYFKELISERCKILGEIIEQADALSEAHENYCLEDSLTQISHKSQESIMGMTGERAR
ncbi:hypothetical protein A3K73_09470 [Candidatus Pacearchaeota archaeon RBG_13_36_9]|nr:MAG: hypothetical protein A3K73_09470 [Candidatus Pacearchaeota archaeon RBG_13_36_9]